MNHYRQFRNTRLALAAKYKACALKAKHNGNIAVAIASARAYRRCMRDAAYYEELINGR